jgi:hypothetical protein
MNRAFKIFQKLGFIVIYIYDYEDDQYPTRIKTSDWEEVSYYFENSFDIRFSEN